MGIISLFDSGCFYEAIIGCCDIRNRYKMDMNCGAIFIN